MDLRTCPYCRKGIKCLDHPYEKKDTMQEEDFDHPERFVEKMNTKRQAELNDQIEEDKN